MVKAGRYGIDGKQMYLKTVNDSGSSDDDDDRKEDDEKRSEEVTPEKPKTKP